jgi:hypothetical protein
MFPEEIDDNEDYYSPFDAEFEAEDDYPEYQDGEDKYFEQNIDELDYFDNLLDIDFSGITGNDFKKSLRQVDGRLARRKQIRRSPTAIRKKSVAQQPSLRPKARFAKPLKRARVAKPLSKAIPLEENSRYKIRGRAEKKLAKVVVPDDRKVIVQGASDFILSQKSAAENIKSIQYYKGKKLKPLVLTITNNDPTDFTFELFNPSMPLDYLYSTSNNLNNRIQIAGGNVSYTDILFNMLANPVMIVNAQMTSSGNNISAQNSQPLFFKNKNIEGYEYVNPVNLDLLIDNMQVFNNIIYFNLHNSLNRAFVPDGMDVIQYKVLAGMSVVVTFWYTQVSLKKYFYEEARNSKGLL